MKLISKSSTTQRIIALAVLFAMVIGLVPFNSMSVSAAAFPDGKMPLKYGVDLDGNGNVVDADDYFGLFSGSPNATNANIKYAAYENDHRCYEAKGNSAEDSTCSECQGKFPTEVRSNGKWYFLGVNGSGNWIDWTNDGDLVKNNKPDFENSFNKKMANNSDVYLLADNDSDARYVYVYVTADVKFDIRWKNKDQYGHCTINGPGIYKLPSVDNNNKHFTGFWLGAPSWNHKHAMTYEVVKTVAVEKDETGAYIYGDSVEAKIGDIVSFKVKVTVTCKNCDLSETEMAKLLNVYLDDEYIGADRFKLTDWTKLTGSNTQFTSKHIYDYEIKDGDKSFTNTVTVYPDETGDVPITGEDDEPLEDEAIVNITEPAKTVKVKVKVTKVVKGDKGAPNEDFTIGLNGKSYTLKHNQSKTQDDVFELDKGYAVTEDDMSSKGFTLENVTVSPSTAATYDKTTGEITFKQAAENKTVTITVTNKYKAPVVTDAKIKVTKEVKSDRRDNPPKSDEFTVTLYDGKKVQVGDSKTVTANRNITFDITDPGTYFLKETGMPSDYYEFSRFSGDGTTDSQGYRKLVIAPGSKKTVAVTVTNKYEPPADGALTVNKKIVDRDGQPLTSDYDKDDTNFKVQLFKNGRPTDIEKDVSVNSPAEFPGLVYNNIYSVKEIVPEGFSPDIKYEGNRFKPSDDNKTGEITITNQLLEGYKGEITVTKSAFELTEIVEGGPETDTDDVVDTDTGENVRVDRESIEDSFDLELHRVVRDANGDEVTYYYEGHTFVTNRNGYSDPYIFKGLPYGTYRLLEVNPNKDYRFIAEDITIDTSSSSVEFEAQNELDKGKEYLARIDIVKTGDDLNRGHKFKFSYRKVNSDDSFGGETISDDEYSIGYTCSFTGLEPGTYLISEIFPIGFETAYKPQSTKVTVDSGNRYYEKITIDNEPYSVQKIEVIKELTGPAPKDVVFTFNLYKVPYNEGDKPIDTKTIKINKGEDTGTTTAIFENLPMNGTYVVVEEPDAEGLYVPVDDYEEKAMIAYITTEGMLDTIPVTFTNTLKGEITVEKVDKGGNTITTSEATFQLLDGDVPLKTQSTIDGFATFSGLEIGKVYTLKEIEAPTGYAIALDEDGNPIEMEIELTETDFKLERQFKNETASGVLSVEKTIEDADGTFKKESRIVNPNEMVIQVVVKNEGNAPLYNLKVVDAVTDGDTTTWADYSVSEDLIDGLEVKPDTFDGKLAVGETVTFTYTTTPPEVGDTHADTVTVTGTFKTVDDEATVVEEDSAEAESVDEPVALLSITKSVNGTSTTTSDAPLSVTAGSTLTFTFTVRNTGNVDLTDIVVTDTTFGVLTDDEFDGSLAAGAEYTFTRTLDAPTAGQTHTNVVTAIGFYEDDEGVTRQTEEVTDDAYARTPVTPIIDDIRIRDSSGTYSDITSGGTTETTSGETPSETVEPNYVPTGTPDVYQLMDEDDTPLGYFTPVLREDGNPDNPEDYDWVEVDEDGTPLGIVDIPKDNPKTNDNSFNKIRYIALIASACLALACVVITRKRRATSTNR